MNASHKTAIKFQDLYIPVKMLKVYTDNSIELNQLCKDSKERVWYRKYCSSCDKEITNEDIVKGYKYADSPDKYIVLEQSDINSITTDKDKTLSIHNVINLRKRATPDTSISFDRIEISGIVLETVLDV